MDALTNFILAGNNEFTPETLIRYMVFVLVLSCICSIVSSIMSVGR